jgi:WD40 repeat protein
MSTKQTLNPPFINSLAFSPDGSFLIAGSGSAEVLLFDMNRKAERRRVVGHTHSVMHV